MAIAAPVNETVNGIVFACFQRYSPSCTTKIEIEIQDGNGNGNGERQIQIQMQSEMRMHLYLYLGSVIKRYFTLIQDLCIQHSLGAAFPIRIATKTFTQLDVAVDVAYCRRKKNDHFR